MRKRQFLSRATGLLAAAVGASIHSRPSYAQSTRSSNFRSILTVTGNIERVNRGKLDPIKDILMYKQGIKFDRAYAFNLPDLDKLKQITIHPTMEDDGRVHKLSGPRLVDVLRVVGMKNPEKATIRMRGIDGYSPEVTLPQIEAYNYIVATKMDDQLFSIGGYGPLFALYDADRIAEIAKKPLNQRFVGCPWGLYCIEVVS